MLAGTALPNQHAVLGVEGEAVIEIFDRDVAILGSHALAPFAFAPATSRRNARHAASLASRRVGSAWPDRSTGPATSSSESDHHHPEPAGRHSETEKLSRTMCIPQPQPLSSLKLLWPSSALALSAITFPCTVPATCGLHFRLGALAAQPLFGFGHRRWRRNRSRWLACGSIRRIGCRRKARRRRWRLTDIDRGSVSKCHCGSRASADPSLSPV